MFQWKSTVLVLKSQCQTPAFSYDGLPRTALNLYSKKLEGWMEYVKQLLWETGKAGLTPNKENK